MPRMKKKNYEEAPDVPTEADLGLPAWLEQLFEEQRAMIAENWATIQACGATQPDSKIKLQWTWALDLLDTEGSVHQLKLRYSARPFVDERTVGQKERSDRDSEDEDDEGRIQD